MQIRQNIAQWASNAFQVVKTNTYANLNNLPIYLTGNCACHSGSTLLCLKKLLPLNHCR